MSTTPILVFGATGRLGRLVVERLAAAGQPVRVFTRRPDAARGLFPAEVRIALGEFADRTSLDAALRGVERLLLLSPISERLAADQIAVAQAAGSAGVRRIVKISGSDWTIDPPGNSISGDAHAAVERQIAGLPLESVSLRPNAWMQVSLANTIRQVLAGNPVFAGNPDAGVGYIDARDIAEVAVHQLTAERIADGPLNLTGPQIWTPRQIAERLSRALDRRISVMRKMPPTDTGDFEHRAVAQFAGLIGAGHAAVVTATVATLLGRTPRSAETFIAEQLAAQTISAGSLS